MRRASGSRTAPPAAPSRTARPPARAPGQSWRRSAGPARRAGCAAASSPRSRLRASAPSTTAASSRSPRYLGKMTPRLGSPTWCPARPTRCRPLATLAGDSTWITRSTAPMSMPSSSELVATMAGSRPALSASSIWTRCSRASEPWWARTSSSPASSLSLLASRSASRRRVAEDDRGVVLADQLQDPRVDRRPDAVARLGAVAGAAEPLGPRRSRGRSGGSTSPSLLMSSTGTRTDSSSSLARAGVDDRGRRGLSLPCPARRRPGSGRSSRPGAGSPRGRSAAAGARSASRAAPG